MNIKGGSSYCFKHQDQDPGHTTSVATPGINSTLGGNPLGSVFSSISHLFSIMSLGPNTPIRAVEDEVMIGEKSSNISEETSDDDGDEDDDIQHSPAQAKYGRTAAGNSTSRSTSSPATLLHVAETSSAGRVNRRAKSGVPLVVPKRNVSQSQATFQKYQSFGMGLQGFLNTLSSQQEIAIAASVPKIFPHALKGRLWDKKCQGPTQTYGPGVIYVYKISSSKGIHSHSSP